MGQFLLQLLVKGALYFASHPDQVHAAVEDVVAAKAAIAAAKGK